MNATLCDRLILLEQLFLVAVVAQDETALQEISLELSQLIHHFKAVDASGDLDNNTALLLSRVSQVIRATTQCVLECEDIMKDQIGLISCSSLPLPSHDLPPVSTSRPTFSPYPLLFCHVSSSGTLGILGHNRLLDACAYRWLRQNIHNPFPTSTQLQLIGDESMTSVAQAGRWFQEARDAIGWTKLSDEFFTGALTATITAAKRVYLEHDNTIPFGITFAFSKVKAFMETLFAEHPTLPTPITSHVGSAQALQPVAVGQDLFDNDEIEDTTPPPPVAGCKRNLSEDSATSLASDLHRPTKRLRAQSLRQVHPHSEGTHPSGYSKKIATEASTHTSAIAVPSVQPSDPSFPVGSKASSDTLALSIGQRQTDLYDSASEMVVIPSDLPASHDKMRTPEGSPQVSFERHLNTSANHTWNPSPGSVPTFAWPISPSLDHPLTDFTGASQITVRPASPVDLSVFDWNSIPNPLVENPILMNQPASVYVPSSDLAPLNFGLPDPLYTGQSTEKGYNPPYPLGDLGSLEDFSLLQFPIPATLPPDVSTSPTFCSDNSTPEMDWSAFNDFINEFTSFSAETSSAPSPSSTFDAAPSTPENPIGSLLPPPPHEVNKSISVLDSSIPPSAFLPAEPGIFTDDASSMWSLLCGLS